MPVACTSQIYDTLPAGPVGESSSSMYEGLVIRALEQLADQNPAPLDSLATELVNPAVADDESKVLPIVQVMSRQAARLDNPAAAPLIDAVLDLDWRGRSQNFTDSYVRFLAILASAIPRWWTKIAHKVVEEFVYSLETTSPHHKVIDHIVQIIPTSGNKLASVFAQHFPHKQEEKQPTVNYVRNLLKVTEYAPELQRAIWGLLMEKTMQLDVECEEEPDSDSEDDDDDDDDDDDGDDDDDADADDVDADVDDVQDAAAEGDDSRKRKREEDDEPAKRRRLALAEDLAEGEEITNAELTAAQQNVLQALHDKLDAVMVVLLDYLDKHVTAETVANGTATPLFIILLDRFKEFVLPTHTTRSVQYLLFKMAHAHPDLLDAFLVSMVEMALSPTVPVERRQKAMQYISSFVARAKGLSRAQIVFVVTFLAGWVDRYIIEREGEVDDGVSMARFRMFYAAVQALMYIFCFRHGLLRKADAAGEWEADLDKLFQRVIVSRFNPLKYCKSTVVAMFARIARQEDAAYCFTVMEQNRVGRFRVSSQPNSPSTRSSRSSLATLSAVVWPDHKEFSVLEGYFPFDPLSLKNTQHMMEDIYVEWDDVNVDDSDSASVSSDSDQESDSDA